MQRKIIPFISSFGDIHDIECVSVFAAWLSNGHRNEFNALKSLICIKMRNRCYDYVMNEQNIADDNASLFRIFTNKHFHSLVHKLRLVLNNGSLLDTYRTVMEDRKKRCRYAHEAFADMFGGGTLFDTRKTKSTFFRYNLIHYWLYYKLGAWQSFDTKTALLPCNDEVFENAYKFGVTKRKLNANLKSAVELTAKAKEMYGETHFYKMYEECVN